MTPAPEPTPTKFKQPPGVISGGDCLHCHLRRSFHDANGVCPVRRLASGAVELNLAPNAAAPFAPSPSFEVTIGGIPASPTGAALSAAGREKNAATYQALEALDILDDYARVSGGVDALLRGFILARVDSIRAVLVCDRRDGAAQQTAEPAQSYAEWCGEIDDEATLRRAVSLFEDILLDIADWEDKAMAEAIEINRDALQSMIDMIRLRGGDTPPRARTLGDEMMGCVDRLGSEADTVRHDVWKHLLPHAPTKLLLSVACLRAAAMSFPAEGGDSPCATRQHERGENAPPNRKNFDNWSEWHGRPTAREGSEPKAETERLGAEPAEPGPKDAPTPPPSLAIGTPAAPEVRKPDGWAYSYPGPYGGLRFNGGQEVNGCKPEKAVPYFLGEPDDEDEPVALHGLDAILDAWNALPDRLRLDPHLCKLFGAIKGSREVAEVPADARDALVNLLAACDAANGAAIQKLGGVVIDFADMEAARSAIDPDTRSFCGGWPNVLKPPFPAQEPLKWDDMAAPTPQEPKP